MKHLYGLMTYEGGNLGDEIQSIAARRFLPRVDVYLNRDGLNSVKSAQKIKLIMNGWFMHNPANWPPSPDIEPLFVSFHITPEHAEALTRDESIRYFKEHEPIGCRDYYTRDLLRNKGVDAYFSGCLTLTLEAPEVKKSYEILIADLDPGAFGGLPKDMRRRAVVLDHYGYKPVFKIVYKFIHHNKLGRLFNKMVPKLKIKTKIKFAMRKTHTQKFEEAEKLLERYAAAKLVITSRLHSALPCLAFGTPVIFVHKNLKDPRFGGLLEYLRSYSIEEFKSKISEMDWDNPPENPKSIEDIRKNLIGTCEDFINRE